MLAVKSLRALSAASQRISSSVGTANCVNVLSAVVIVNRRNILNTAFAFVEQHQL